MPIRPGLELEVFTDWSEVVGSVLAEAGGESFLGNLRARDEAEDDRAADADALLELAREAFGDEFFTARQLVTGVGALSARVVDLTGLRPGDSRLVNRLGEHLNGHRREEDACRHAAEVGCGVYDVGEHVVPALDRPSARQPLLDLLGGRGPTEVLVLGVRVVRVRIGAVDEDLALDVAELGDLSKSHQFTARSSVFDCATASA